LVLPLTIAVARISAAIFEAPFLRHHNESVPARPHVAPDGSSG
jgi:hypothetical protein